MVINMTKIAKFEKVSFEQFKKDFVNTFYTKDDIVDEDYLKSIYENIKLPERKTSGSAGYDIFSPISFNLLAGENYVFPTGIKVNMEEGWVFTIHVRSSIGFKYGIELSNTTGIIDKDYYNNPSNEGHIFIKMSNNDKTFKKNITVFNGDAVCQGIFLPFGITVDDHATQDRVGGIGSTNKQ